jgi:methionyl-tRNA synthetase
MAISRQGNLYWQETQPWKSLEANPARTNTVLAIVINCAYLIAHLVEPFMPTVSEAIQEQVNQKLTVNLFADEQLEFGARWVRPGHKIGNPEPLFRAIDEKVCS